MLWRLAGKSCCQRGHSPTTKHRIRLVQKPLDKPLKHNRKWIVFKLWKGKTLERHPKRGGRTEVNFPPHSISWSLLVQYTLVPSSQCQQKKQKRPKLFGLCFAFCIYWQWKENRECQITLFCRQRVTMGFATQTACLGSRRHKKRMTRAKDRMWFVKE
jgi:hypothetical protein